MPAAVALPSVLSSAPAWPETARRGTPLRRSLVLLCFVALYVTVQFFSYSQRSATYDETLHLAAGYAALTRGDFRFDPTHPPLARMWAALPLLDSKAVKYDPLAIDRATPETWYPDMYAAAHEFLDASPQAEALLNRSRLMNVVLGAVLGFLVFAWAEAWLGFGPAVATLAFYLLSPDLLAHAGLVTTDLAITLLFFAAMYFLWRACRDYSTTNVAGFVACFALAQATKFSAVVLAPLTLLMLALATRFSPVMTWRRAAAVVMVTGTVTWATLWVVYGLRYEPSATPGWVLPLDVQTTANLQLDWLARPVVWADAHRLVPNAYAMGFLFSFVSSESQPGFLAGEIATGGWWYYFPIALLIKTPSALLLLAAGGGVWMLARARRIGVDTAAFLLLPPAVFLAAAMTTDINIGLRHVLPVLPFLLVIAAAATKAIAEAPWARWVKWGLLCALATRWIVSVAAVYPHTLTFFNVFVGGPRLGYHYLADSNLDWGQGLKQLKNWMAEHQVDRINLAYFGTADPVWHDIKCTMLPGARDFLAARVAKPELPGYVAIGTTVLSGPYLSPEWRILYAGFENRQPVAVLGNSVHIYWVGKWPEAPAHEIPAGTTVADHARLGDALMRLGWNTRAIYHYRRYLRSVPDDARAHAALGEALFGAGRSRRALAEFRRAVELDPADPELRRRLATLLYRQGDPAGAAAHLQQLVELNQTDARAWDLLGIALARAGRQREAIAALERAAVLAPGDPAVRNHLTQIHRMQPEQPPSPASLDGKL